jgi:type IV secretory pathway VirD2 relaxase
MEKRSDDVPRFRPRIGGRRGQVPYQRAPRFIRSVLARARLRFVRVAGIGRAPIARKVGSRRAADVARPSTSARRCVIKARVVRLTDGGIAAARLHLAYIERDGVERDGSPGRLYGEAESVDRDVLAKPIRGERHQFRFIVSPEDDVDLTSFTRELMAAVERDLSVRLRWGAVNHHDTDNPHAHVVVRGVDAAGRQVRIDREYISNWMRWQAQHILTAELGPRLAHDVERQLDREVGQERLTSLDHRLARALGPDQSTDLRRLAAVSGPSIRRRLVGRLQALETLQLASRTGAGAWQLVANWQEALRDLGERGDIIKRIHRVLGEGGDPARYRIFDGAAERPAAEGVVRRKGLHDELRGDAFAIVETPRGEAAYVRLDAAAAASLVEGSIVSAGVERQSWAKPMDRVLAQVARESGGVYDSAAHLDALRRRPLVVAGKSVRPEDVVEANVRRLSRLERYRLVAPAGVGRWTVPADLLETLASREFTHPQRAVRVKPLGPAVGVQITARYACWLDEQDPAAPRAPYGFGATLDGALEDRVRFVRDLGIPTEPRERRLLALGRLERLDVARRLAAARGARAVEDPLPSMRGRLLAAGRSAAGADLACVHDEAGKRLVVIALPPDVRRLLGQPVTLERDAAGRVVVRSDGLKRGG